MSESNLGSGVGERRGPKLSPSLQGINPHTQFTLSREASSAQTNTELLTRRCSLLHINNSPAVTTSPTLVRGRAGEKKKEQGARGAGPSLSLSDGHSDVQVAGVSPGGAPGRRRWRRPTRHLPRHANAAPRRATRAPLGARECATTSEILAPR